MVLPAPKIEMENLLQELYILCRQQSYSCADCAYHQWDGEEISIDSGGAKVDICALDASLIEWQKNRGSEIPEWIVNNWEKVQSRHAEVTQIAPIDEKLMQSYFYIPILLIGFGFIILVLLSASF